MHAIAEMPAIIVMKTTYPAFGLMIWPTKDAISPPPTASTRSTRHGKNTIRNSCTVWIVASLSVKYCFWHNAHRNSASLAISTRTRESPRPASQR